MLIPDVSILNAINNLVQSGGKDWTTVFNWIVQSFSTETFMLIDIEDERQSAILSGRCRELKEILHYIEHARAILEAQDKTQIEPLVTMSSEEAVAVID